MRLHKYKLIGEAIYELYQYLKTLPIYTLLDARNILDSQQKVWGRNKIYMRGKFIFGDDIKYIDQLALEFVRSQKIIVSPKDHYFLSFLSVN